MYLQVCGLYLIKIHNISNILLNIAYTSEYIPLIFFLFLFRKLKEKKLRYFFIYICYEALNTTLGLIINNHFRNVDAYEIQLRIYNIIEFVLISFTLIDNLESPTFKKLISFSTIAFFIFCIYDYLTSKHGIIDFDPVVVECIVMLLFLIYFLYEKINNDDSELLHETRTFWIAVAFFIYFSGNFFLFLYSRTMTKDKSFMVQYTLIFSTIVIIKNLFILIALLLKSKNNERQGNSIDESNSDFDYSLTTLN